MITRNASRLQNLAESILQVSRIESGSFSLDIQKNVDLHNLITQVIEDIEKKYAYKEKANKVSIMFLPFDGSKRNSRYAKDGDAKSEEAKAAADEKQAQKEQRVQPVKNIPNHLLYIDCDSQKISQVVFNLLDNAMKFTEDGKIVVSTTVMGEFPSPTHSPDTDVSNSATIGKGNESGVDSSDSNGGGDNGVNHIGRQKKDAVLVAVQDTGVGLNPKIKDQLFEKFVTKSNQGTGLGLYLSKKIVEEHGGRIWFEETNNNGSNYHNNENKDEGIDEILHHLGSDKKIGATFKFRIPFSLSAPMPAKDMP
jgi:signal transduction histidine kinase